MRSRVTWGLLALLVISMLVIFSPAAFGAGSHRTPSRGTSSPARRSTSPSAASATRSRRPGAQGTLGPNLDQDAVTYTRVVTAIEEGVGGIQAEYVLRSVTFKEVYDVAKYVVTVRAAGGTRGEYS